MLLASWEGMWWVTYMLVAPTTWARLESLWGVEGLFYYRVGQWRLIGDLLLGSLLLRESVHTNGSCVLPTMASECWNADVKTWRCTRLQILLYTACVHMIWWYRQRCWASQDCGNKGLIYIEEWLAYQWEAFTMRPAWIQECARKHLTKQYNCI